MIHKYLKGLEKPSKTESKIEAIKVETEELNSFVYYDYNGYLHFIIASDEVVSNENRKGLKVGVTTLDIIDKGENKYINFTCTSNEFKDLFMKIIEEILTLYKEINDLPKSISFTINKWYFFLEKDQPIILAENIIKGVIGELIFIKTQLDLGDGYKVIKKWIGPNRGIRDFSFDSYDIEVKTSTKEIGHVHAINGQQQLVAEPNPLFIFSVSLKKSHSENAITLKKIVDYISLKISGDKFILNDFFEKLELLNILANQTEMYDDYKYEIKDILTVKINNENNDLFLLENTNTRISKITYDLDLNGLTNEEI